MIAGKRDITEEIALGRRLLLQGHLDTALKVLVKLCQEQPESSEAFRTLAMVLFKRGDDRRGQPLLDYADELDVQEIFEPPSEQKPVFSDSQTAQTLKPWESKVRPPESPAFPGSAAPVAPVTSPAPGFPEAIRRLPQRRGGMVLVTAFALIATGVAVYALRGRFSPPPPSSRGELDHALASGSLDALMRARDAARIRLPEGRRDPDALVLLGLLNALLASDYGVDPKEDSEALLRRAVDAPDRNHTRLSLAESARALFALAAGDRIAARQHAEAAISAPEPGAWALLASARVRRLSGDAGAAGRDLDRAMASEADLAPVVVDWAVSRLDGGDPVAARRALAGIVATYPDNSLARLALAKADRALGEASWAKTAELACRGDTKISRVVRSGCALQSALKARLDGDRAGALRKSREAAQMSDDLDTLADAALLGASLGDIDGADEILARARRHADLATVPLLWVDFAIRLGRAETARPSGALEHPAGLERGLAALRAAYAHGNVVELALRTKSLPPGTQDIDGDLRAFTALARSAGPAKPELDELEKSGEKGNPVASYVLGLLAMRDKDYRTAVRRLEKALALHGDACQAGQLLVAASKQSGHGLAASRAALRAIRARNAKCTLPDM